VTKSNSSDEREIVLVRIIPICGFLTDNTVFDFITKDLAATLDQRKISKNVFLCHSLGCFIGLYRASLVPGSLVIAINMPSSPWRALLQGLIFIVKVSALLLTKGRPQARRYADAQIYFGRPDLSPEQSEILRKIESETNRFYSPRSGDFSLIKASIESELKAAGASQPQILVIQGTRDPLSPLKDQKRLRTRVPNACFVSIDGGHVLPLANAIEVSAAMDTFLFSIT
jgi:pimeloyl-ACP methyl ester carboxylesterase